MSKQLFKDMNGKVLAEGDSVVLDGRLFDVMISPFTGEFVIDGDSGAEKLSIISDKCRFIEKSSIPSYLQHQENYQKVEKLFESHDMTFETVQDAYLFIGFVLRQADFQYRDEYHYREYPNFSDFLNTHHVDAIVHAVSIGDYDVY